MTKFKKNTHLSLPLNLSICRCTLIFPKGCACTSIYLFLYLHLQKRFGSRSDPNGIQERMFRQFKKKCACDRKYAKCRTKADAHDKMGFQYISIRVYIVLCVRNAEYIHISKKRKNSDKYHKSSFSCMQYTVSCSSSLIFFFSCKSVKRRHS